MIRARSWCLIGALLGMVQCALAADVPFSGALSAADPVYKRVQPGNPPTLLSGVGTAVSYDVVPFFVTASSTFIAETLSAAFTSATADDTFITLYQTSFNPASALTNALIADDDTGVGSLSSLTKALTVGTQYYLVVTSFDNGQFGPYTGHINSTTGVGQVVIGTVPELPTAAMMLMPLALGALVARRRRQA